MGVAKMWVLQENPLLMSTHEHSTSDLSPSQEAPEQSHHY